MRLPSETKLDNVQSKICNVPAQGTYLVIGPAGSGKTVTASWRVKSLQRANQKVMFIAWSTASTKYTNSSQTFESWLKSWWIELSNFHRKGVRLNKVVKFVAQEIPTIAGHPLVIDYKKTLAILSELEDNLIAKVGICPHIILDNAQDYSIEAHQVLASIIQKYNNSAKQPISLMLFVDESQRYTKKISTVKEIRSIHKVRANNRFELNRNYRNTRRIVWVARHFNSNTRGNMQETPELLGEKPKLLTSCSVADLVVEIAKHVKKFPQHDIGVFIDHVSPRTQVKNLLSEKFANEKVLLQGPTDGLMKRRAKSHASKLKFDQGGTITVLPYGDSRGIEFDAVFIPALEQLPVKNANMTVRKLLLNSLVLRARTHLTLALEDENRKSTIWRVLPRKSHISQLFDVH